MRWVPCLKRAVSTIAVGVSAWLIACVDGGSVTSVSGGTVGAGGALSKNALPPCNERAAQCQAGQTCWLADGSKSFECLDSGPARVGEACTLVAGRAECADGLICIVAICTPYCTLNDPNAGCPGGEPCTGFQTNDGAVRFSACLPPSAAVTTSSSAGTSSNTSTSSSASTTGTGGA